MRRTLGQGLPREGDAEGREPWLLEGIEGDHRVIKEKGGAGWKNKLLIIIVVSNTLLDYDA